MTRQQLDLLIRYINTKVAHAAHEVQHHSAPRYMTDDMVTILAELEESTKEVEP